MLISKAFNASFARLSASDCMQVQHDFNRNYYFNTQEAKEYGIIDNIIKPPRSAMLGV